MGRNYTNIVCTHGQELKFKFRKYLRTDRPGVCYASTRVCTPGTEIASGDGTGSFWSGRSSPLQKVDFPVSRLQPRI